MAAPSLTSRGRSALAARVDRVLDSLKSARNRVCLPFTRAFWARPRIVARALELRLDVRAPQVLVRIFDLVNPRRQVEGVLVHLIGHVDLLAVVVTQQNALALALLVASTQTGNEFRQGQNDLLFLRDFPRRDSTRAIAGVLQRFSQEVMRKVLRSASEDEPRPDLSRRFHPVDGNRLSHGLDDRGPLPVAASSQTASKRFVLSLRPCRRRKRQHRRPHKRATGDTKE